MLTREDNDLLTRVGPGTPMGALLREYWMPVVQSREVESGGKVKRVQLLGERMVVYLPVKDEEGKFIQRQILVGQPIGDRYTVLGGLEAGDVVVTEGSFFLRAESLRNSPR